MTIKNNYIILTFALAFNATAFGMDQLWFDVRRAQRRIRAHTIKSATANNNENTLVSEQNRNGDEQRYSDKRGSFGKGLLHNDNGFISNASFQSLITALESENPADFNRIQTGDSGDRNLVNPQASLAFSLSANDGWIHPIPAAPAFASAQTAGEMVELYWTALVRDVPFNEFDTDATVGMAVADLNDVSDFRGPKEGGVVTRNSFLRGNAPDELVGPYISQFLYQTVPFGAMNIPPDQMVPTSTTDNDFMTDYTDWFTVVNAGSTGDMTTTETFTIFIRTPRDLAEYVHVDGPGQGSFCAALLLNSYGADALDRNNPYLNNTTQDGFTTFGLPDVLTLMRAAIQEGLKAAWYHKWLVHRRLRPEEFGFYVNEQVANGASLGLHDDLINSPALTAINSTFSSYFLPQAYPEGSPTHPSYPAGHAVLMGAAVTILKAFFNEDYVITSPIEPDAANNTLIAYTGDDLTVGGELNKLASNVALGRDHAGVHYRSDGWQGMLLGEKVAIDILNNQGFLINENFGGFSLTTFEGNKIVVGAKQTV